MNADRDGPGTAGDAPEEENESQLVTLARFSGHGLTLALATGLFLIAGWWIDGKLGTTPLLTILGALTGAAAGFYSLLQSLVFFPARQRREREEAEGSREEAEDSRHRDEEDEVPG